MPEDTSVKSLLSIDADPCVWASDDTFRQAGLQVERVSRLPYHGGQWCAFGIRGWGDHEVVISHAYDAGSCAAPAPGVRWDEEVIADHRAWSDDTAAQIYAEVSSKQARHMGS